MRLISFFVICIAAIYIPKVSASSFHFEESSPYLVQSWTQRTGLQSNDILHSLQCKHKFIWLATHNGLIRFDGVQFQRFNQSTHPEFPAASITRLFEDRLGHLWIGTQSGQIARFIEEKIIPIELPDSWPQTGIYFFQENQNGDLIAYTSQGFRLKIPIPPLSPSIELSSKQAPIYTSPSKKGGYWIKKNNQLIRINNSQTEETIDNIPWHKDHFAYLLERDNGNLVAGTLRKGVYIYDRSKSHWVNISREQGLVGKMVFSLLEDEDKALWVSTDQGLNRITTKPYQSYFLKKGDLSIDICLIHPRSEGGIYIGTHTGDVYSYFNDNVIRLPIHPLGKVATLLESHNKTLYLGPGRNTILAFQSDGIIHQESTSNHKDRVYALLEDKNENLWAGKSSGLWTRKSHWIQVFADVKSIHEINCLANSANNDLWIGTQANGLFHLASNTGAPPQRVSELTAKNISALYVDPDDGSLWIGTFGNGLYWYNNKAFFPSSLDTNIVTNISQDSKGRMILTTEKGICAVSKAALKENCLTLIPIYGRKLLGHTHGITTQIKKEQVISNVAIGTNGDLLFVSDQELISIAPEAMKLDHTPQEVIITEFKVNQENYPLPITKPVRLEPGVEQLRIHFTTPEFESPQHIQFKYRFTTEQEWTYVRRAREINLLNVSPGDYQFEIHGQNPDGIWNTSPARIHFSVLPFFHQRFAFKVFVTILSVLTTVIITYLAVERINRKKLILAEKLHAVEQERNRISMDIHDQVGSDITGISLLSKSMVDALSEIPQKSAEKQGHELISMTHKLVQSFDEIIWVVKPINDNLNSLASYLTKFVSKFLRSAQIEFDIDIPFDLPEYSLAGPVRHHIYLVTKEALNNIVKHSKASRVIFQIKTNRDSFEIKIEDNGIGIQSTKSPRFHQGLDSMKARMQTIGGKIYIESRSPHGTSITLNLPLV